MNIALKVKRVEKGLTQKEVSKQLGIVNTGYSLIETGKRSGKLEIWLAIQKLFEIPDEEMWGIIKANIKEKTNE